MRPFDRNTIRHYSVSVGLFRQLPIENRIMSSDNFGTHRNNMNSVEIVYWFVRLRQQINLLFKTYTSP